MRSSRWQASLILPVAFFLAFATAAHAAKPNLPTRIAKTITATWTCQEAIGQKRTKAGNVWAPHSHAYRKWQLSLWKSRLDACEHQRELNQDVVAQLESGLARTPMSGTGKDLLAAARAYKISPFFIAAIAGTESSFGAAACRNNRFNAFGLSSCGSGWSVPYFRSWREAYFFMGAFLTGRTRVTSGWPNARTTMDYRGYAACSDCWGRKTAMHMRQRFGVGPEVRW